MRAGTVLDGRYRLTGPIGAGGFGEVWEAHDPKIDRLVAVKLVAGAGEGGADSDRRVARFAREAAVAGGLSHPNIVTVHDFGSTLHHGRLYAYLVMELVAGQPLSAYLQDGPVPLRNAVYTAGRVAEALGAAHRAGLTHRDIKPSNIIITPNGGPKVVDFGITKSTDTRHDITATGILIGTPAYMAPECFNGTFDHRSDLYSLGCVLYEMLTGQRPFTGSSWHLVNQHANETPPPVTGPRPDTPPRLADLVETLLAKNPADRPADADQVADLLRDIDNGFGENPPLRGQDISSDVQLTAYEAAHGAVVPLRLKASKVCPACASRPGRTASEGCVPCEGTGRVGETRTVRVRVPAGVRDGQRVRIQRLGAPGQNGGAPGDLFATVHVRG
ncbi:protein kinase domain-containing protein [Streptomyces tsukubensis]|uniref:protein kinase domain-containing protein n=1 Tax=Streptomyces tsukubensis TaxID=83656 RepID=UPI00344C9599